MTSPFGSVTSYVPVAAGSHRIQVASDGKGTAASVIDVTASLSGGTDYTVAALGTQASGFSLKAFVGKNWVRDDRAKLRVYHQSPDAGPVNAAVGGATVIHGLTYKNVLIVKVMPLLFACKQTCCRVLYAVVLRDSSGADTIVQLLAAPKSTRN